MKDKFENIDGVLCDKLFNFIYPDENNMTDEEIQAELQILKIDTRPAMDKIRFALTKASERKHAQESLVNAKQKRLNMLEMVKGMSSTISGSREEIRQWIMQYLTGSKQAMYCRKLEETSDKDLKSLAEDILRLEELGKSFDEE